MGNGFNGAIIQREPRLVKIGTTKKTFEAELPGRRCHVAAATEITMDAQQKQDFRLHRSLIARTDGG
jgi:hypothetical protein